ncbi:MAG: sigma 54-interacting transcriptional regulator [Gemmataceae bacterium]
MSSRPLAIAAAVCDDDGMADPPPAPPPGKPRFPWRAFFHASATPVFVVGPTRRLRYANPAWERLTGKTLAQARGMRLTALKSGSALGQALAPPAEAWAGRPCQARRPVPPADAGPPWWDVAFTPFAGDGGKVLGVLGAVTAVGEKGPRGSFKLPAAVAELAAAHAAGFGFDRLAGPTPATERLVAQARLAAATTAPVWIVGEPGTGKETLARVVHHAGPTRERAFFGVDCHGIQPYLIETQLFGKGGLAYGGHLGTVYLKDPAALPRDLQERLAGLFAVPRPKAPRLICGATSPAAELVAAGRLVPTFHTALSVFELHVPPLRERLADLPRLVDRLPDKPTLADDVWPVLRSYYWPGNVRELAELIADAAAAAGNGAVTAAHLPRVVRERHLIASVPPLPAKKPWTLDGVLEAVERRLIELAMWQANGSQTAAAEQLGVFRARLGRRIEALGLGQKTDRP